jgi:hypothetical protein
VPNSGSLKHDVEEWFVEIRDIEVIPAGPKGVFGDDVVGGSTEEEFEINGSLRLGSSIESV